MGWLRIVASIKLSVSFTKEPYKRDNILQKRPLILSILLNVATPHPQSEGLVFFAKEPNEKKVSFAKEPYET